MTFKKKFSGWLMFVIMVPVLVLASCTTSIGNDVIIAQKIIDYNEGKYDGEEASGELVDGVREIRITAYQFFFDQEQIIVNNGERVRLIISSEDVPHGFEIEGFQIPDYDISTVIRPGMPLTIEFEVDEKGVWEFICTIYCGFGHSTMKGLFIVR